MSDILMKFCLWNKSVTDTVILQLYVNYVVILV